MALKVTAHGECVALPGFLPAVSIMDWAVERATMRATFDKLASAIVASVTVRARIPCQVRWRTRRAGRTAGE